MSASRLAYRGRAFDVLRVKVANPGGGAKLLREVVRHGPSAVILARDPAGRLLFERQFRAALGTALWELPAGGVEPGETPPAAARRELAEETGYTARRWRRLGCFYSSPGFLDEQLHVFLAEQLRPGAPAREADEVIRTRWVSRTELARWLHGRRIRDGKSLAALTLLAQS